MIKIEFPADRPDIARAMATALRRIGGGEDVPSMSAETARQLAEDFNGPLEAGALHDQNNEGDPKGGTEDAPKQPDSLFGHGTAEDAETHGADPETTRHSDSPADARVDENSRRPRSIACSTPAGARVDGKGVPFNGAFCGESRDPFYATGKMQGQWKKRRGVDQAAYDEWYEGELGKLDGGPASAGIADRTSTSSESATVNAGAAFGAQTQQPEEDVPNDAGTLMVWISEKQAAGLLTQDDVNEAYQITGVKTADLFGDNPAPCVAAVHTFLNAKVKR